MQRRQGSNSGELRSTTSTFSTSRVDIEAGHSGSQNDAPSSKNAYDVWKVLIITYDHIIKSSSTMTHGMWHGFVPGKSRTTGRAVVPSPGAVRCQPPRGPCQVLAPVCRHEAHASLQQTPLVQPGSRGPSSCTTITSLIITKVGVG
jgi:hypothetical protein